MINEIRALDPKPGLVFGSTLIQPVVPDVFVRQSANGDWIVELNSDTVAARAGEPDLLFGSLEDRESQRGQDVSR